MRKPQKEFKGNYSDFGGVPRSAVYS